MCLEERDEGDGAPSFSLSIYIAVSVSVSHSLCLCHYLCHSRILSLCRFLSLSASPIGGNAWKRRMREMAARGSIASRSPNPARDTQRAKEREIERARERERERKREDARFGLHPIPQTHPPNQQESRSPNHTFQGSRSEFRFEGQGV